MSLIPALVQKFSFVGPFKPPRWNRVKAVSKKLEDPIANPKTPVKDSPAKPKISSCHRHKSSGKETKQSWPQIYTQFR